MKFQLTKELIPQNKREEINNKIVLLIESGKASQLPMEAIFNGYTGVGGLHGLDFEEFDSYSRYSDAKKEIENGQFFTPPSLAAQIVESVPVQITDLVADLTCGMGTFFNFLPVEGNCYGCEVEANASKVARYLFPSANIETQDIRYYRPSVPFDIIYGNPPFGIDWRVDGREYLSQAFFMKKSFELLAPGGILAMIAPLSFLNDDFMARHMMSQVSEWFGFLGQAKLPATAFSFLGVKKYATKVMYFQKRFEGIPARPFNHKEFVPFDPVAIRENLIVPALQHKKIHANEIRLSQSVGENDWSFKSSDQRKSDGFRFRLKKFLFEIKTHPVIKMKLGNALGYIKRFETQVKPDDISFEEWNKIKLTEEKVLSYLVRIIRTQDRKRKEGYSVFNDASGICIKAHDAGTSKLLADKNIHSIGWAEIVQNPSLLSSHPLRKELKKYLQLARRKRRMVETNIRPLDGLTTDKIIDDFVESFRFINPQNSVCSFNQTQKTDLGRMLQHDFGILSWQQGSGKTVASWAAINFRTAFNNIRNCFVIAPPIAVEATWIPFLTRHKANFLVIRNISDVSRILPGQIVVCALSTLSKVKRFLKRHLKMISYKAFLVFDESDEITNYKSNRSHAMRNVFRKLSYKLLTTGTTTRNHIAELYGQLELLYNNSMLFNCDCEYIYKEEFFKDDQGVTQREIVKEENKFFNRPFPARGGMQLFKGCYAPTKSTVFGVQKHNQDVFNAESLRRILGRTVITRKFKDIAGDGRFEIHTHRLTSKPFEQALYERIMDELNTLLPAFYRSTGNSRKDSMLRIIRQLQLLIKSCSIPHIMEKSSENPAKAAYIRDLIIKHPDEKIILGTTSVQAAMYYSQYLRSEMEGREVMYVTGKTHSVSARQQRVDEFQSTKNAILICTEQSLSSSINIPSCSFVILESLQWNIPKMEQFYFRTIRFDSPRKTNIHFVLYKNSIEVNLMALLTAKERLNDFIKTHELRDHAEVMEDFGLDASFLDYLLQRVTDQDGKVTIQWGKQKVTA